MCLAYTWHWCRRLPEICIPLFLACLLVYWQYIQPFRFALLSYCGAGAWWEGQTDMAQHGGLLQALGALTALTYLSLFNLVSVHGLCAPPLPTALSSLLFKLGSCDGLLYA